MEIDLLITLVQKVPVLSGKTLEEYKYKNLTLKGWEEIRCILNKGFENEDDTNKTNMVSTVKCYNRHCPTLPKFLEI